MRGDLAPPTPSAGGCYDGKVSSAQMVDLGLHAFVINGPSAENYGPFVWSESDPTHVASKPHEGQPDRFDFRWEVVHPQALAG